MPQIGRIPLTRLEEKFDSGAAFLLINPPAESKNVKLGSEVEIEIEADNPYVVVRLQRPGDENLTRRDGLILAQQGLDYMSITGIADLATKNVDSEYISWWSEEVGTVLRVFSTTTLRFDVNLNIKIEGQDRPNQPTRYHTSYRYFRLAQVGDELHDAYRNMYLAFELILSSIDPPHDRERETVWIKRVLSTLGPAVLPRAVRNEDDPIEQIVKTVYIAGRLPLFHAKEGREFTPPSAVIEDREDVEHRLRLLTELYLNLARHYSGPNRGMGPQFFRSFFRNQYSENLNGARIFVTDYDGPHDASESDLSHPRFSNGLEFPGEVGEPHSKNAILSIGGELALSHDDAIRTANRVELAVDELPISAARLEWPVQLDGVAKFMYQLDFEQVSHRAPKSRYPF